MYMGGRQHWAEMMWGDCQTPKCHQKVGNKNCGCSACEMWEGTEWLLQSCDLTSGNINTFHSQSEWLPIWQLAEILGPKWKLPKHIEIWTLKLYSLTNKWRWQAMPVEAWSPHIGGQCVQMIIGGDHSSTLTLDTLTLWAGASGA